MVYVFGFIVFLMLIFILRKIIVSFFAFLFSIITLEILPSGLERLGGKHKLFDGQISTVVIPLIGHVINYFNVLFINIIDFIFWGLSFIPLLNIFLVYVYKAPDEMEKKGFSYLIKHRNYLTHSILNPVILGVMLLFIILFFISKYFNKKYIKKISGSIVSFSMMVFSCHLLADSMPVGWQGNALIRIVVSGEVIFSLNSFFSKLWLLSNAYLIIFIAIWILGLAFESVMEKTSDIDLAGIV